VAGGTSEKSTRSHNCIEQIHASFEMKTETIN
jgi:hypothetical protein